MSPIGAEDLLASYDSRTKGYISRVENQAHEGLCWAYAYTTTVESYLRRQGIDNSVELSPKHLDYILATPSKALSDSTENAYVQKTIDDWGYEERNLAEGSNYFSSELVSSGKNALVEDDDFFAKMKTNDSTTLGSFNSYGDYISSVDTAYEKPQPAINVFDQSSSKYAVVESNNSVASAVPYGSDTGRDALISEIKNAILNYGAVAVKSYFDPDHCMYINDINSSLTIIDKTGQFMTQCSANTGHGMTLVGWDDDWTYKDGDEDKKGAFIVQNSYKELASIPQYFAYSSFIQAHWPTLVKPVSNYAHIYDITEHKENSITAGENEVIFEFSSDGNEYIDSISFFPGLFIVQGSTTPIDVYISTTGNASDFTKVGSVNFSTPKIYNLSEISGINLDGDFAVKISMPRLQNYDEIKATAYLSVYTKDGEAPTPTPTPTPTPDPTPQPEPEPDPVPVPNTDSGTGTSSKSGIYIPNTGVNSESTKFAEESKEGASITLIAILSTLSVASASFVVYRKLHGLKRKNIWK